LSGCKSGLDKHPPNQNMPAANVQGIKNRAKGMPVQKNKPQNGYRCWLNDHKDWNRN